MGLRWSLVMLVLFGLVISLGCISISHSTRNVFSYWHSINSFTASEIVKIGNQTFDSYVNFTKPDEIARADYINGSLAQKVIIENNTQKVITASGTFILNATLDDVNALDPFASILNNLDSFNVTGRDNTLFLSPKVSGLPSYEVELDGKLPKKITVKQAGLVVVVEYKKITVKT